MMTDHVSNDNDSAPATGSGPDAHGQASMLLVESLIHGLIARSVITVGDAVEIVDTAAEIEQEIAAERDTPADGISRSSVLLSSIRFSLVSDG